MKKYLERIKQFIKTVLRADNYIMIGINGKTDDPDTVSMSYTYHANIEVMGKSFVEIIEQEKKKQDIINETNKIINNENSI